MHAACNHAWYTGILRQIRDMHRTLKARATDAGQSLSEFLRQELGRVPTRPTELKLARRLRSRTPVDLGGRTSAQLVSEIRDETAG